MRSILLHSDKKIFSGDLFSSELPGLEARFAALGQPRFRAEQVFQWIHGKGVFTADRMHNLPKALRISIEKALAVFPVKMEESVCDGDRTEKFRFRLQDGAMIESVLIPGKKRLTLCLSTQVGCAMGCVFCRTGRMGWQRDLTTGEILGQFYAVRNHLEKRQSLSHIVLMGMGEPLANLEAVIPALRIMTHPLGGCLSTRRITVSTVGLPEPLKLLFQEIPVTITLSLNAADNEVRNRIMPVNRQYPLEEVLETLRNMPLPARRRYTIAYVIIQGVNDHDEDARKLVSLLHGIRCKVNLIPFNPFPGSGLKRPQETRVLAFRDFLRSRDLSAHLRVSRGAEIQGACGQLAGNHSDRVTTPSTDRRLMPWS